MAGFERRPIPAIRDEIRQRGDDELRLLLTVAIALHAHFAGRMPGTLYPQTAAALEEALAPFAALLPPERDDCQGESA